MIPIPLMITPAGKPPWKKMWDSVRLKVKPPTLQKAPACPAGELKFHCNAVKDVASPLLRNVAKSPSRLITVGEPTPPAPCHPPAMIAVAVPAEAVSRVTLPAKVMAPVIG